MLSNVVIHDLNKFLSAFQVCNEYKVQLHSFILMPKCLQPKSQVIPKAIPTPTVFKMTLRPRIRSVCVNPFADMPAKANRQLKNPVLLTQKYILPSSMVTGFQT